MALHIGLISGTSTDAVDAALVDLTPDGATLVATHSESIPDDIATALRTIIDSRHIDRVLFWQLDVRVGRLFADAAVNLLDKAGIEPARVRAIGSHGQTVYHAPDGDYPSTVQIGDPNVIAERTGITTVADLRRRDMAAGGQGAPLATAFHAAMLRSAECNRVVLNVGGIANVTVLPANAERRVIGFDTGPGNTLMDVWIQRVRGAAMDTDGAWARSGRCHRRLLELLESDEYFSRSVPKSTGRELFNLAWLDGYLARLGETPRPEDVQRTLCELTATSVAAAVSEHAPDTREVLVCGGGAHNRLVMERLGDALGPADVRSTESIGVDPDWVEATTFAWLAARTLDGLPGNLPSVTGAAHPVVLGAVYKGG